MNKEYIVTLKIKGTTQVELSLFNEEGDIPKSEIEDAAIEQLREEDMIWSMCKVIKVEKYNSKTGEYENVEIAEEEVDE